MINLQNKKTEWSILCIFHVRIVHYLIFLVSLVKVIKSHELRLSDHPFLTVTTCKGFSSTEQLHSLVSVDCSLQDSAPFHLLFQDSSRHRSPCPSCWVSQALHCQNSHTQGLKSFHSLTLKFLTQHVKTCLRNHVYIKPLLKPGRIEAAGPWSLPHFFFLIRCGQHI